MGETDFDGYLAEARRHVGAANYDVQRMAGDAGDRQALHSVVLALDAILAALEDADTHVRGPWEDARDGDPQTCSPAVAR